jgi:putative SOS response-associated peptidase YedK
MCGRYRLTAKERYIRDHFGLEDDVSWAPRWNIAPTQQIPIVRQDNKQPKRTFSLARWGLIPYWAKDRSLAAKTINAMSETAAEKPAFRDAVSKRRCLIPADAFYEWVRVGVKEKQPYSFGMIDDSVFAFAGLWDRWRDPGGDVLEPGLCGTQFHGQKPTLPEGAGCLSFSPGLLLIMSPWAASGFGPYCKI